MMTSFLLHENTKKAIDTVAARRPQAVIVTGSQGVGKGVVAMILAEELLGTRPRQHPYFMHIDPEANTIGIDVVREIQEHLKLRTPGTASIRRVILIADAQRLTTEAQNAMLKILEEPPADTCIIMTTNKSQNLLATISSRASLLRVTTPSSEQLRVFFERQYGSDSNFDRNCMISDGLPGLFVSLMTGQGNHNAAIETGKHFLTGTAYERLCAVDRISKGDLALEELFWAIDKVARAAQQAAIDKGNTKAIKSWQSRREAVMKATEVAAVKPSKKLVLTELALSL